MTVVTCVYCGDDVEDRYAYEQVKGWRRRREAGGANQITLPEPLLVFSCDGCIRKLKMGIDPTRQGSLL